MLGVVGSNLKMVKFSMQHLWMLHDVVVVWPGSCNNVAPGHAHSQHVPTHCNRVAKQLQHVGPTMLRSVAFKCCDRLAGDCKCWANIALEMRKTNLTPFMLVLVLITRVIPRSKLHSAVAGCIVKLILGEKLDRLKVWSIWLSSLA